MHSHKSSGTVHRPPTVQSSVGPMPGTSKQRTAAVRTPAAAAIRQTVTRNTDLRSHVFIRLPPKYAFLCPKGTPPRGDVKSAFAMFPSLHGVFSAIWRSFSNYYQSARAATGRNNRYTEFSIP